MKYKEIKVGRDTYTVGVQVNYKTPDNPQGIGRYAHKIVFVKGKFKLKKGESIDDYGIDFYEAQYQIFTNDGKMNTFSGQVESIIESFIEERDKAKKHDPLKTKDNDKLESIGFK